MRFWSEIGSISYATLYATATVRLLLLVSTSEGLGPDPCTIGNRFGTLIRIPAVPGSPAIAIGVTLQPHFAYAIIPIRAWEAYQAATRRIYSRREQHRWELLPVARFVLSRAKMVFTASHLYPGITIPGVW
eukprot:2040614-Rhodomonas_salina.2